MKNKAFTLIEMIVTIGIMLVLVLVASPKFAEITEQSRVAKTQTNMLYLRNALSNYYYEAFTQGRTVDFPDTPDDSLMTHQWAAQPLLHNNRSVASLFSENRIVYNPKGNPYRYVKLEADEDGKAGFRLYDVDYHHIIEFRP
jgi:prepilin-type N-terminal cleavage/methylation domain-containing protein